MRKKLLSILVLTALVTSTLVGCSGDPSSTSSTLTIFSITQGDVFVMKAGTDQWTEATVEMPLEVGDTIKTGDDSGAEITFFDGSTIDLDAGTQIKITSLDTSADTGTKTITLMQTIGTTVSRVTKLLDPASTYAIETPSGVAAVRGSTMVVRIIFNDPNYEDGTVLITSLEGQVYFVGNGDELQLPVGAQVIANNETAELVQLPIAVNDAISTDEDTPVTVAAPGVLANDSGLVVGDTLTVTGVDTSGTVGTVTWDADGSFTYDPNGQFEYLEAGNSTTDSFTYTVTDDYGITDTASVTITINGIYVAPPDTPPPYTPPPYSPPVNHPPVAVDDTAATGQNTSVAVYVLSNDHDPDLDTITVDSVTQGTHGSVSNDVNHVTYTPDSGFTGSDSFDYTISDGKGGTATATVTVTITSTNINYPPVARTDAATTQQGTPVIIDVLSNDSDPNGDTLVVSAVTQGTNGAVTNNGGDVTYTPDPGFTGTDSFDYTVSDGKGGSDTATVTVTVTAAQTPAYINVQINPGNGAILYIYDDTAEGWIAHEYHATPATIQVAVGHYYYVWVTGNVTYDVGSNHLVDPQNVSLEGGGQKAYGCAAASRTYSVHFTETG